MKSIKSIYRDYQAGMKRAIADASKLGINQDLVSLNIVAIKWVDDLHKKVSENHKSFAVAILNSGDLILTRPCDYHCVITCHEEGVERCASIATGTVFYTLEPKHIQHCLQ